MVGVSLDLWGNPSNSHQRSLVSSVLITACNSPILFNLFFKLFCDANPKKHYKTGISWSVGDGTSVSFWHDSWLLKELFFAPVPADLLHVPVRYFWNGVDDWNVAQLSPLLSTQILQKLQVTNILSLEIGTDQPCWSLHSSDCFSIASLRNHVLRQHPEPRFAWSRVWNFRGPTRASLCHSWPSLSTAQPEFNALLPFSVLSYQDRPGYRSLLQQMLFDGYCRFPSSLWKYIFRQVV